MNKKTNKTLLVLRNEIISTLSSRSFLLVALGTLVVQVFRRG